MNNLENAIISEINPPYTVYSEKNRYFKTTQRASFGLSFCRSGQITYTMNGKKFVSHPGNVILLPQGGTYELHGDSTGWFPIINFKSPNLDFDEIIVIPLQNPQPCIKDFETINNLFINGKGNLRIYRTFYDLLHKLSYEFIPHSERMASIVRYIENNISSAELSNIQIANHVNISEVYLRKLFLTFYDTTPKQYILDVRMRKAKQFLTDTEYTVTEISEKCGFSSLYHFCRIFRNKTGMTPTEYASTYRNYEI